MIARMVKVVLCALLAVGAAAQRTWVVDDRGGPGVDFRTIEPAVTAATEGDIILVRRGSGALYANVQTLRKAVRIIGEDGNPPRIAPTRIEGIAAGSVCGFENVVGDGGQITVIDCAGLVILRGLRRGTTAGALPWAPAITRCGQVIVDGCEMGTFGYPVAFVEIRDSCVAMRNCTAYDAGRGSTSSLHAAVEAFDSDVDILDCRFFGANAQSPGCLWYVFASYAILARTSTIRVRGDSVLARRVGIGECAYSARSPISYVGSSLQFDPSVTLLPGTPRSIYWQIEELTTVLAGAAVPGSAQTIDVLGLTGGVTTLLASLVAGAPPVSLPAGTLWLDPGQVIEVGTRPVPIGRQLSFVVPVPLGIPPWLTIAYQAVSLDRHGALQLGNPALTVIR